MFRRILLVICLTSLILTDPVYSAEKKPSWMECLANVFGRTLMFSLMIMDHCQAATQQCEWTEQSNAEMMLDRVQCHAHPTARRLTVDHIPDDYRGDLIYKGYPQSSYFNQRRDGFIIHDIRSEKGRSINHRFVEHGFDFISLKDLMDEQDWQILQESAMRIEPDILINDRFLTVEELIPEVIFPLRNAVQKWAERVYSSDVESELWSGKFFPRQQSVNDPILGELHLDHDHTMKNSHHPSTFLSKNQGRVIRVWFNFNHDLSDIVDCPLVVYDPLSFPKWGEWKETIFDSFLYKHAGVSDAYWQSQMPFGDAIIWDVERVAHHGMCGVTGENHNPRVAGILEFTLK